MLLDYVERELELGERIVTSNDNWMVVVPSPVTDTTFQLDGMFGSVASCESANLPIGAA
ncbi:MAG TPA: hypothetical protein VLN74_12235 [Ilumatobacteraceae bacterium]|nr:hypothetical protein [Ilumatobacteraceae bacterium]